MLGTNLDTWNLETSIAQFLPSSSQSHRNSKRVQIMVLILTSAVIQHVCVCVRTKLLKLCLTLRTSVDCSPPGSSVHDILQARTLERVAMSFSRGSSQPRDGSHVSGVSCTGRRILYHCPTREALECRVSPPNSCPLEGHACGLIWK